jgi:hypothetical protein
LADVLTTTSQKYHGRIYIGDAGHLNKPASVGFLFNNYRSYFEYQRGGLVSSIDYLNSNPLYIRTLISQDPQVTFDGAVNDTVANTHTLLVAAIAPTTTFTPAPLIEFKKAVGADKPLYSLNAQTAVDQAVVPASSQSQYGSITSEGASTYSGQTYSAAEMTASATTTGGTVTFSVWDPAAKVTFILPTHTTSGQTLLNLYNGNSASLAIYGSSNYANNPNTGSASGQWSAPTLGNALGYVEPASYQAPPVNPTINTYVRTVDGGSLREAIDFHADQVQMIVDERALIASVSLSAPVRTEVIRSRTATGNTLIKKDGGDAVCSADDKGDLNCGD